MEKWELNYLIISIMIILALVGGYLGECYFKASHINKRYNTDYTTLDMLWFGDNIAISDYFKVNVEVNK